MIKISSLANWNPWSDFGACSKTCGIGTQTRSRTCANGNVGDPGCDGAGRKTQECETQLCREYFN